jgi:hypothetical protein
MLEYGRSNKYKLLSTFGCLYNITMPCQTERQQAADALQRANLVNLMAEHEEDLLDFNSDSSSSGNNTDSSSSSSVCQCPGNPRVFFLYPYPPIRVPDCPSRWIRARKGFKGIIPPYPCTRKT